ncbi:hypothetical protein CPB86DRAFT_195751 [Serendipita vermifera]|nr:hypothetical protein CPB86DRAFT_195751 [Serendipita vermifera]
MSAMVGFASLPHPRELPTEDEIRHCKSVIALLDQNIQNLEDNIRKYQAQLEEIRRKKANYVSYISPLRRLPTDILSEIVDTCLHSGVEITTITGIFGRMREAALGMTRIWSNISLHSSRSKHPKDRCYGFSITVSYYFNKVVQL